MARTQRYAEELLLEAVVRYAETGTGKIKATELAEWARTNIRGLEDVRDYHFLRPVKERDPNTGKISSHQKPCTARIEEINRTRSLTVSISKNALLRASTIEEFMDLPDYVQRHQIAETREMVDKLAMKNDRLTREMDRVKREDQMLHEKVSLLDSGLEDLQKRQNRLIKQVTYLMKATDETARKDALAAMGIEDGDIDLDGYTRSLQMDIDKVMDLKKIVAGYLREEAAASDPGADDQDEGKLADVIMSGIDFQVDDGKD